jgi:hypothetical protein
MRKLSTVIKDSPEAWEEIEVRMKELALCLNCQTSQETEVRCQALWEAWEKYVEHWHRRGE